MDNIYQLACLQLSHQNKPIECICTAEQCKAKFRLYCVICSSEQLHKDCEKQYQTKEDLMKNFDDIIEQDSFILKKYDNIKNLLVEQLQIVNDTISMIREMTQTIKSKPYAAESLINALNIIIFNSYNIPLNPIIDSLRSNYAQLKNNSFKQQPLQNISEETASQTLANPITSLNQVVIKTKSRMSCMALSSNNILATCGHNGIIYIYNSQKQELITELSLAKSHITMVQFSSKDNFLAAVSGSKIIILQTLTWARVDEISTYKSWFFDYSINFIQFSNDEQLIHYRDVQNIHHIWDLRTKKCLIKRNASNILFQLSTDCKYVALGQDHKIVIVPLPKEQ